MHIKHDKLLFFSRNREQYHSTIQQMIIEMMEIGFLMIVHIKVQTKHDKLLIFFSKSGTYAFGQNYLIEKSNIRHESHSFGHDSVSGERITR